MTRSIDTRGAVCVCVRSRAPCRGKQLLGKEGELYFVFHPLPCDHSSMKRETSDTLCVLTWDSVGALAKMEMDGTGTL